MDQLSPSYVISNNNRSPSSHQTSYTEILTDGMRSFCVFKMIKWWDTFATHKQSSDPEHFNCNYMIITNNNNNNKMWICTKISWTLNDTNLLMFCGGSLNVVCPNLTKLISVFCNCQIQDGWYYWSERVKYIRYMLRKFLH